jgi:hypothetical protein
MIRKQPTKEPIVAEHTPTPEEARDMFKENPGLAAVVTTEGMKLREELL